MRLRALVANAFELYYFVSKFHKLFTLISD